MPWNLLYLFGSGIAFLFVYKLATDLLSLCLVPIRLVAAAFSGIFGSVLIWTVNRSDL